MPLLRALPLALLVGLALPAFAQDVPRPGTEGDGTSVQNVEVGGGAVSVTIESEGRIDTTSGGIDGGGRVGIDVNGIGAGIGGSLPSTGTGPGSQPGTPGGGGSTPGGTGPSAGGAPGTIVAVGSVSAATSGSLAGAEFLECADALPGGDALSPEAIAAWTAEDDLFFVLLCGADGTLNEEQHEALTANLAFAARLDGLGIGLDRLVALLDHHGMALAVLSAE